MTPIWNTDPAAWRALTLTQRLAMMRKWYCTGPSSSCASAMQTRATLEATLREAERVIMEYQTIVSGEKNV